jgi:Tol biopolymer transport system component/PKD repeat protein/pimeloyl-ACP methyl ester carboxylesterase
LSSATNLVDGDTNGVADVFIHDRQMHQTRRVSVSASGMQANGASGNPSISADGLRVVFSSDASNLVEGDTNNSQDIFVVSLDSSLAILDVARISVGPNGEQGDIGPTDYDISGDGQSVVYLAAFGALTAEPSNNIQQLYMWSSSTRTNRLVSRSATGEPGNSMAFWPNVSHGGRYAVFSSWSSNLVPDDSDGNGENIFLADYGVQGVLAFTSSRTGDGDEVFVMNADGTGQTNVSNRPGMDKSAIWSPDGKRFVYSTTRSGVWELWLMDADGTNPRLLINAGPEVYAGGWSADGSKVLFDRGGDIFRVGVDGSGVEQITPTGSGEGCGSYSPNGEKILLLSDRTGIMSVNTMNPDGTDLVHVVDAPGFPGWCPHWSPDGRQIAFPRNGHIFVVNADGSSLRQLTNVDGPHFAPSWSPDGSSIAFTSSRDGNNEIYVMDSDGSNQVRLTYSGGNDDGAMWRPNGTYIAPEPPQIYTINGRVTNAFGAGLPGITIEYAPDLSTVTDANGNFLIEVSSASDYLLKPSKPGHVFDPPERSVSPLPPSNHVDFTAGYVPTRTPVIFIPGIMGSTLQAPNDNDFRWPNLLSGEIVLDIIQRGIPALLTSIPALISTANSLTLDTNSPDYRSNLYSADATRRFPSQYDRGLDIYASFLDFMTHDGGYVEYGLSTNEPTLQPGYGCDGSQWLRQPTLFVFPYDWRKSNSESASLLGHYIDCIRKFYPDTKVDIVAHSMGGLVARRYILDQTGSGQPQTVRKLTTIATPWLGAPKFITALETGWLDWKLNLLVGPSLLRELVATYPGAHELLPSRRYYDVAAAPFQELGWDFDGSGTDTETYSYDHLRDVLNQRYSTSPGETADRFHAYPGQDDWSGDSPGVEYHYIVGRQFEPKTIAQILSMHDIVCWRSWPSLGNQCSEIYYLRPLFGPGDGTVPIASARRSTLTSYPDGNVMVHEMRSYQSTNDGNAEHGGMVKTRAVQDCVLAILRSNSCAETSIIDSGVTVSSAESGSEIGEAYFIQVLGQGNLTISDASGRVTGLVDAGVIVQDVPATVYVPTGDESASLVVSTDGVYTMTLRSGDLPLYVEVLRGVPDAIAEAVRYQDISLPPGVTLTLRLPLEFTQAQPLTYDADGDGASETPIPPSANVTGPLASDSTPPSVAIFATQLDGLLEVRVPAYDDSGIESIYYSSDGISFQLYEEPLSYALPYSGTVYAFADDKTGLRSTVVSSTLQATVNAPIADFTATPWQGTAPLPVQFVDASTGVVTAWVWSFGDGGQSSEQHPAHTYQAAGVFTATLTVSGPGGWHSTAKALRVTPPPPTFTADPPVAGGLTVPFTFTPPPGVTSWLWEFGDGQTSTAQNPVHTYAAAGDYTVRLTVYAPGGVSASQELAVTVRAGEPNPAGYSLYLPSVRR